MKYFIKTFGCQMNEADSEQIAAAFQLKGYQKAKTIAGADVVVINSCSVRQSAEDRVLGLINNLRKKVGKQKIILTGCMLRYSSAYLQDKVPGVDEFVKVQELISGKKALRKDKLHAWFPIMQGCDNFCTYCVVPYARGRERSVPIQEVYESICHLVSHGYKEVTLLGQNVNSYHKGKKFQVKEKELKKKVLNLEKKYKNNFAVLLALLHELEGLEKIKFITSNPHDLQDGIIKAMKLPKIDRYLHLAVQSGDDLILKKMNRKYTSAQYLNLLKKIRREIPDIQIGTDIIVGFPGETKQQFENTLSLAKKAKFKIAYISKYSPRLGTVAYKMKDDVSPQEKKKRWQILNKLINKK